MKKSAKKRRTVNEWMNIMMKKTENKAIVTEIRHR